MLFKTGESEFAVPGHLHPRPAPGPPRRLRDGEPALQHRGMVGRQAGGRRPLEPERSGVNVACSILQKTRQTRYAKADCHTRMLFFSHTDAIRWPLVLGEESEHRPSGGREDFRGNTENYKNTTSWAKEDF